MNLLDREYKKTKLGLIKICLTAAIALFTVLLLLTNTILFYSLDFSGLKPETESLLSWSIFLGCLIITIGIFFFLKAKYVSHLQILENLAFNYKPQRKLIGSYFSKSLIADNEEEVRAIINKKFQEVDQVKNFEITNFPKSIILSAIIAITASVALCIFKPQIIQKSIISLTFRNKSIDLEAVYLRSATKTIFSDRPTEINLKLNRTSFDSPYLLVEGNKIDFKKISDKEFYATIPPVKNKSSVNLSLHCEDLKTQSYDYKVEPLEALTLESFTETDSDGKVIQNHYRKPSLLLDRGNKLKINFKMNSPSLRNFGIISDSHGEIPFKKNDDGSYSATYPITCRL